MKRTLCLILTGVLLLGLLSGCETASPAQSGGSGREQVTVALWGDQLTEQYGTYLQERFPQVDFTFYVATNSTDFYRFKEAQGDLPDILTVRRFALRDVADWKDALLDLSDTELANDFPHAYLRSYTYSDGTVNWLPTCAEVDSILLNKTLLENNGIAVPNNYSEFIAACAALQAKGIRPFLSNFAADYTCMEILQGLSAELLTTQEGREWRQQYESGQTDQLSEAVWLPIFTRMEEFLDVCGIDPADLDLEHEAVFTLYDNGEAAMLRGTGDEIDRHNAPGRETLLLPYFGESETENWYLTYPSFQVAASARAEEDPQRKALILDILAAMLDKEGQQRVSSSPNVVPYTKEQTTELPSALSGLQPYLDNNQLYIRLASADMFAISRDVVQGMIRGEYPDARSAFDAFNAALRAEPEPQAAAAHIEQGYPYAFDPQGGSPAASAVMNSLREELGTELLIAPAAYVAGNIAPGDYSAEELRFLTMGEGTGIALCQMTGEQVYQYVDYVLTTPGMRGSVINDSTLFVSSGFTMEVEKTDAGYALKALTQDGQPLDREAVYTTAVVGSATLLLPDALAAANVTDFTPAEGEFKTILVDRLAGGTPLAEPTDYIMLD